MDALSRLVSCLLVNSVPRPIIKRVLILAGILAFAHLTDVWSTQLSLSSSNFETNPFGQMMLNTGGLPLAIAVKMVGTVAVSIWIGFFFALRRPHRLKLYFGVVQGLIVLIALVSVANILQSLPFANS